MIPTDEYLQAFEEGRDMPFQYTLPGDDTVYTYDPAAPNRDNTAQAQDNTARAGATAQDQNPVQDPTPDPFQSDEDLFKSDVLVPSIFDTQFDRVHCPHLLDRHMELEYVPLLLEAWSQSLASIPLYNDDGSPVNPDGVVIPYDFDPQEMDPFLRVSRPIDRYHYRESFRPAIAGGGDGGGDDGDPFWGDETDSDEEEEKPPDPIGRIPTPEERLASMKWKSRRMRAFLRVTQMLIDSCRGGRGVLKQLHHEYATKARTVAQALEARKSGKSDGIDKVMLLLACTITTFLF